MIQILGHRGECGIEEEQSTSKQAEESSVNILQDFQRVPAASADGIDIEIIHTADNRLVARRENTIQSAETFNLPLPSPCVSNGELIQHK